MFMRVQENEIKNLMFNVWWIFSSSISGVEKVKQCHNCYQKQIIKEEIFQHTLRTLYLCLLTSIASGTFWIFHVFYPDKIKLIENHHYLCTAMFLISVFTSFYIIWSLFSNLFPNSIILKKIKKKKNK